MASVASIERNGEVLYKQAVYADRFWPRTIGLLARESMDETDAIVLTPCHQIHTFGMKFSIDVVFLNSKCVVMKCVENIAPKKTARCRGARYVVELSSGSINRLGIGRDQQLDMRREL